MIAELWKLHEDLHRDGRKSVGFYADRLKGVLQSDDSKYADVLKQMAEDERHLRELVDRLEKIVGMGRSTT